MIVFSFRDRECMCRFEFEIMMIEEQEHERKWPIVLTKSKRKQLDFTVSPNFIHVEVHSYNLVEITSL
jgi:hypothetical protein